MYTHKELDCTTIINRSLILMHAQEVILGVLKSDLGYNYYNGDRIIEPTNDRIFKG